MMKPSNSPDPDIAFRQRVNAWAIKMRVKPKQVRLQKMTRKWASCSASGRVTFSVALLEEAHAFQEYVIVHELLHLKVPNHGKLFKSLLTALLPRWRDTIKLPRTRFDEADPDSSC
jgi:predicted metal-dependent hydrolase